MSIVIPPFGADEEEADSTMSWVPKPYRRYLPAGSCVPSLVESAWPVPPMAETTRRSIGPLGLLPDGLGRGPACREGKRGGRHRAGRRDVFGKRYYNQLSGLPLARGALWSTGSPMLRLRDAM